MAIIQIKAGAAEKNSTYWASMLSGMYERWAKRKNIRHQVLEYQMFERGGMLRSTIALAVEPEALESEIGIHRMVRTTPLDDSGSHYTVFASVMVMQHLPYWTDAPLAPENTVADIAFNGHIRNYVFDPYKLVKDRRTGYETKNIQGVLAGNIDGILDAWKKSKQAMK